jgi:hypothetical protein
MGTTQPINLSIEHNNGSYCFCSFSDRCSISFAKRTLRSHRLAAAVATLARIAALLSVPLTAAASPSLALRVVWSTVLDHY